MKFSWEWICEHLEAQLGPAEAADRLSLRGLTVDEVIEIDGDVVFEIDITANRPDAMNTRGVAREMAAAGVGKLRPLVTEFAEGGGEAAELCSVRIEDPDACNRFCARVIRGVNCGPSPDWMSGRLERVGLRSINVLVDITNYVLWELGHPLHGYDLQLVPEGSIVVRRAAAGESLRMIDGSSKELGSEILVIADKQRAIGIGGVMGGADTEINERTVDILLEGAWFDPLVVRRGARALGLDTEASFRFERGADIEGMVQAINRCCRLYAELAGGTVLRGMVDEYPRPARQRRVGMSHKRLEAFAGMEYGEQEVRDILSSLELPAELESGRWLVEVPTRRVDIEREADLFEEVIRVAGFERVPPTLPRMRIEPAPERKMLRIIDAAAGALLGAGFTEVMNYDFIDPDGNRLFAPPGAGEPIEVTNPIATPQMVVMRQSLAPSLLKNISRNYNHGCAGLRIFETARYFDGAAGEHPAVCIAADAHEPELFWHGNRAPMDFFEFKGVMESIFTRLGVHGIIFKEGTAGFLAPEVRADMELRGSQIGWLGQAAQAVTGFYGLPDPVFIGQVDLEALSDGALPASAFQRASRFPSVSRDVAFTPPQGVSFDRVLEAVSGAGVEEIAQVRLLEVYRGDATSGESSLTLRIVYRSAERTLTQEEVEELHGRVRRCLGELGVRFR